MVTPSVQSLVLNRQIYNKMEINRTQACHSVVCYQQKPPRPEMASIATGMKDITSEANVSKHNKNTES